VLSSHSHLLTAGRLEAVAASPAQLFPRRAPFIPISDAAHSPAAHPHFQRHSFPHGSLPNPAPLSLCGQKRAPALPAAHQFSHLRPSGHPFCHRPGPRPALVLPALVPAWVHPYVLWHNTTFTPVLRSTTGNAHLYCLITLICVSY
jgi:hypothetical protein